MNKSWLNQTNTGIENKSYQNQFFDKVREILAWKVSVFVVILVRIFPHSE